jgi:hypothetical protein
LDWSEIPDPVTERVDCKSDGSEILVNLQAQSDDSENRETAKYLEAVPVNLDQVMEAKYSEAADNKLAELVLLDLAKFPEVVHPVKLGE